MHKSNHHWSQVKGEETQEAEEHGLDINRLWGKRKHQSAHRAETALPRASAPVLLFPIPPGANAKPQTVLQDKSTEPVARSPTTSSPPLPASVPKRQPCTTQHFLEGTRAAMVLTPLLVLSAPSHQRAAVPARRPYTEPPSPPIKLHRIQRHWLLIEGTIVTWRFFVRCKFQVRLTFPVRCKVYTKCKSNQTLIISDPYLSSRHLQKHQGLAFH